MIGGSGNAVAVSALLYCSILMYAKVISTWFGVGLAPKAPGTAGSIAALLFFPIVAYSWIAGVFVSLATFIAGTHAVSCYLKRNPNTSDPKEVVVDEVCGQVLVFSIPKILEKACVISLHTAGEATHMIVFMLSGLISFRVFDIAKPWPICSIDKGVKGAWGVMLDDVVAAIPASVTCMAITNGSMLW